MNLIGSNNQQRIDGYFDYSGTITTGGAAQLMVPQRRSCSHLVLANNSVGSLFVQFGVRPATATLTSGVVTSVTINDAGFGFQYIPNVTFLGGGESVIMRADGSCGGVASTGAAAAALRGFGAAGGGVGAAAGAAG